MSDMLQLVDLMRRAPSGVGQRQAEAYRTPALMMHWIKFNVVGVVGFALQSAMLFVITHSTYQVGYLAATAIAVELAVLNNFFWHQRWTWKDRPSATRGDTLRRLAKFNITNGLFSIAGNMILMTLLVGHLGLPITGANLISVATCSIFGFILADRIAFAMDYL